MSRVLLPEAVKRRRSTPPRHTVNGGNPSPHEFVSVIIRVTAHRVTVILASLRHPFLSVTTLLTSEGHTGDEVSWRYILKVCLPLAWSPPPWVVFWALSFLNVWFSVHCDGPLGLSCGARRRTQVRNNYALKQRLGLCGVVLGAGDR